jgi:hypothetical protein
VEKRQSRACSNAGKKDGGEKLLAENMCCLCECDPRQGEAVPDCVLRIVVAGAIVNCFTMLVPDNGSGEGTLGSAQWAAKMT